MLNKIPRTCKTCKTASPHTGRTQCLKCIGEKQKKLAMAKKTREKVVVRKEKATIKKRFSRSNLVKEADRVFSIYVRDRDRGLPCITCEALYEDNFQCGHFLSRRHLNTRWVKTNAHGQCPKCNLWGSGEQFAHGLAIDKLYGEGISRTLQKLAHNIEKTTDQEIIGYIRTYYKILTDCGVEFTMKKYFL